MEQKGANMITLGYLTGAAQLAAGIIILVGGIAAIWLCHLLFLEDRDAACPWCGISQEPIHIWDDVYVCSLCHRGMSRTSQGNVRVKRQHAIRLLSLAIKHLRRIRTEDASSLDNPILLRLRGKKIRERLQELVALRDLMEGRAERDWS